VYACFLGAWMVFLGVFFVSRWGFLVFGLYAKGCVWWLRKRSQSCNLLVNIANQLHYGDREEVEVFFHHFFGLCLVPDRWVLLSFVFNYSNGCVW